MKNENGTQTKYLVTAYMLTMGFLFIVVVTTPLFISGHVSLTNKFILEEDTLEALIIATLLGLAYFIYGAYRRELKRLKKTNAGLTKSNIEAFKYIGTVNVHLQELWAGLFRLRRYPKTKGEFREILSLAARHALRIVNAEWILIRIVNQNSFRTITEYYEHHEGGTYPHTNVSNRVLTEGESIEGLSIVCSRKKNLTVNVSCIIPVAALGREEKILIEAVVSQLEMLFIVFTSQYLQTLCVDSKLQDETKTQWA